MQDNEATAGAEAFLLEEDTTCAINTLFEQLSMDPTVLEFWPSMVESLGKLVRPEHSDCLSAFVKTLLQKYKDCKKTHILKKGGLALMLMDVSAWEKTAEYRLFSDTFIRRSELRLQWAAAIVIRLRSSFFVSMLPPATSGGETDTLQPLPALHAITRGKVAYVFGYCVFKEVKREIACEYRDQDVINLLDSIQIRHKQDAVMLADRNSAYAADIDYTVVCHSFPLCLISA